MSPSSQGKSKRRKARSSEPRRWFRHPLVRFVGLLGFTAGAIAALIGVMILFNYDRQAARFDLSAVGRLPQETKVLDATGELMGYLHGEEVGMPVPLESVSPHFINALIAREDSRFYRHHGIDRYGLARAWWRNVKEKRTVQGASTITMQLTRMTYGLTGRNMQRKLLEMAIARRIEKRYQKDEILGQYVNRVFMGTGMNGIEQAAQGYFGKISADLSVPEAAMIAGVIRAPNAFSPFRHYETALREMRSTIRRMRAEDMITPAEEKVFLNARPVVLDQERWMKMLRSQWKISGESGVLNLVEDYIREQLPSHAGIGGLTVQTTIDLRLQVAAERALERQLSEIEASPGYAHPTLASYRSGDPAYLQGAITIIENFTGAVRATVGSREVTHSRFNRATQASRPIGSIFKPLVYGTAFERGLFPGVYISDAKIQPGEIPWDPTAWSPANVDGQFGNALPAEVGLIKSRNTMTVRVGEWAGIKPVLAMMEHAGLGEVGDEVSPTVYIGTLESDVHDVASAYSVFATGGIRHQPHFVESIKDRDGAELIRHEAESYRVLSPGAAWLTSTVLKRVVEEGGTGAGLRRMGFTAPAGGKTGTTNAFFDAWFAGYTSRLSGSVWIGLDQPATILEGAYGGRVAMPVWEAIMSEAQRVGYEFTDFATPEEVIEMEICRITGRLASEACEASGTVYVEQVPHDLIPRVFCNGH